MADNPQFGRIPRRGRAAIATGSATYDGTGSTLLFQADATAGSVLSRIFISPKGTNVATVIRIYSASGAANYALLRELALIATTASSTAAVFTAELPINLKMDPGLQIYVHLSTTVAGGYDITAEAWDL